MTTSPLRWQADPVMAPSVSVVTLQSNARARSVAQAVYEAGDIVLSTVTGHGTLGIAS